MAGERRRPDGALPASWPLVAAELGIQANVIERPGEDGDRDRARSGVLPGMLQRGSGTIAGIASVAGYRGLA
jgi:hypothetical protein